jgi:hypothetical protein
MFFKARKEKKPHNIHCNLYRIIEEVLTSHVRRDKTMRAGLQG